MVLCIPIFSLDRNQVKNAGKFLKVDDELQTCLVTLELPFHLICSSEQRIISMLIG